MNETDTLPDEYEFIKSDEQYSFILERRNLYADSAHFLMLKIVYNIMFGEFTLAAETMKHKELNKPYLAGFKLIVKDLIDSKNGIEITKQHDKFLH